MAIKKTKFGSQFFAAPTSISRTDLSGLIPEPVTREIIQGVAQGSAVLSMGRRLPNMTSKTQSMNVLDMLPTAYWVDMQQYIA